MALAFLNRCGFRAASSGTGSFVVASALTGMQTPAQAAGPAAVDGATYRYFAQSDDLTQWEYGSGVYTSGDTTLTRATVYDNSSGGTTALSFSAAPQVRMGGPLAQDMTRVLLSDQIVSSPAATLVVSLPDGYAEFELFARGITAGAVSTPPGKLEVDFDGEDTMTPVSGGTNPIAEGDIITARIRILLHGGNDVFMALGDTIKSDGAGSNDSPGFWSSEVTITGSPISFPFDLTFAILDDADASVNMTAGRFTLYGTPVPPS